MIKKLPAESNSISLMTEFIEEHLSKYDLNSNVIRECMLVSEEIMIKLIEKASDNSELTVEVFKSFGGSNIKYICEGKAVVLEQEDELDLGGKIIEEYSDSINQSYKSGVNYITLSSSTTESNKFILDSCLAILASVLTAICFGLLLTPEQLSWINEEIVYPIVTTFGSCLGTVATPVAFFSLAAFVIAIRLTFEVDKDLVNLAKKYTLTSFLAILSSGILWTIYTKCGIVFKMDIQKIQRDQFMGSSLGEFLENSVPTNFVEPFMNSNPIPFLLMGVIIGLAAGNYFGPNGEIARNTLTSINGLFCKAMDIVYTAIPFFLYFALVRGWLDSGFKYYLDTLFNLLLFIPAVVFLLLIYTLQLLICGTNPIKFFVDFKQVLLENLKIGSNLTAMPYNKRMLLRLTGVKRDLLEDSLKLGGMMNMDGNCLYVSMGILGLIFTMDAHLPLIQKLLLAVTIMLLSVGAPNQPGSFLLGLVVLMPFIGIDGTIYGDLIIVEALYGKVYSCLNAVGDIVTIVANQSLYEKRQVRKQKEEQDKRIE